MKRSRAMQSYFTYFTPSQRVGPDQETTQAPPPPSAPTPTTLYPATPPPLHQQQQGPTPAGAAPLLVRHLPEAITQEMLSCLFSHYGATSVRPYSGGKLRNCAFVDFRDEAAANHAHSLLNRFRFPGKVLTVERANRPNANGSHLKHQDQLLHGAAQIPSISSQTRKDHTSTAEPIAPKLGVDYPSLRTLIVATA